MVDPQLKKLDDLIEHFAVLSGNAQAGHKEMAQVVHADQMSQVPPCLAGVAAKRPSGLIHPTDRIPIIDFVN